MPYLTRLLRVGTDPEHDPAIASAVTLLRAGELVAFPTETVYGLGGDATRAATIEKIFAAKNRPADNPLIVHVADASQARDFCQGVGPELSLLAAAFWPGPLALILEAKPYLRQAVTRGRDTVALRVPDHPVALALIRRSGLGLAAPSANLSGKPSPTRAEHVQHDLDGRIPLILDGGPCRIGIESTVLDLTQSPPVLLRPGGIGIESLERVLGRPVRLGGERESERSPGTRYRHYMPEPPVWAIGPEVGPACFEALLERADSLSGHRAVAYIGARKLPRRGPAGRLFTHSVAATAESMARELYEGLRHFDREDIGVILLDSFAGEGLALSLLDRIRRSAIQFFESDTQVEAYLRRDLRPEGSGPGS